MQPEIVFQDEQWLVVDKPPGWLSVPSRIGSLDDRPCLGPHFEKSLELRLWPVHRLDFEVSGLVVFAKSAEAHRHANTWFETRQIKKTYEAWSQPPELEPVGEWQEWKSQLVRGKRRTFAAAHGQPALTQARCIGKVRENFVAWELRPLTGRSHQLRFEMARNGYPILGDRLYGSPIEWPTGGIALRAVELDLRAIPATERLAFPEQLSVSKLTDYIPSR